MRAIDISGKQFGRLTVIRQAANVGQKRHWHCLCLCGTTTSVAQCKLVGGHTKSCGCYKRELTAIRRDAPAVSDMPEYWVLGGMIARCHNRKCKTFVNYGKRGISVCPEWRGPGGFEKFISAVGRRPTKHHTIERKNNDGNYEPDNVHWATRSDQSRNNRRNRLLTFRGRTMIMKDWADEFGIKYCTLLQRLDRSKWSLEKALLTPVG